MSASPDSFKLERTDEGTFAPGSSGNPAGRPPNSRNQLAHHKRKLELAVRDGMSADRLRRIITKMADMAEEGHVPAARLILEKFISSAAAEADTTEDKGNGIRVIIENVTFANKQTPSLPPIDVQVTDVTEKNNG